MDELRRCNAELMFLVTVHYGLYYKISFKDPISDPKDIEKSLSGHNLPNLNIFRIHPFFCGMFDVYKQLKAKQTNNHFLSHSPNFSQFVEKKSAEVMKISYQPYLYTP